MAAAVHPPRIVHQDTPTSSPKDVKKPLMKQEDASRNASPRQSNQGSRHNSPPQPVQPPEAASTNGASTEKKETSTTNAQPLGPPPKPATSGADLDYFSGQHGTTFSVEANPFEASFGGASADTPGKSLLPPVASLTSPSTLLPGGTPGWPDSLRSGPLSPAMLPGPSGATDYFGQNFRGSFPTPNESSLRTGLTPGGGGSMFPAPSPNSQLLGLLSGGVTPGFSDFHRTAMSAAAKQNQNNVTSNAQTSHNDSANQFAQEEAKPNLNMPNTSQASDPFGQSTANEAANGLYMLTQAATSRNGNYGMPNQPSNIQTNTGMMGGQSQETSPLTRRGNNKNSIGSMNSGSIENGSETGESEQTKPTTRSRGGKKGGAANGKTNNNRRKADDTPAKAPANKKARANSGGAVQPDDMMDDDDEDDMGNMDLDANGKKMTDEEKRKNFLERNRVAALKCRQRKKQWLQNLQNKVEIYSAENDALSSQVQGLREEIVNLKTLLLAHKDCPVASSQGLQGVNMHQFLEQSSHQHQNPYGLGMPNGMQMQGMGMGPGPMQQGQRT